MKSERVAGRGWGWPRSLASIFPCRGTGSTCGGQAGALKTTAQGVCWLCSSRGRVRLRDAWRYHRDKGRPHADAVHRKEYRRRCVRSNGLVRGYVVTQVSELASGPIEQEEQRSVDGINGAWGCNKSAENSASTETRKRGLS